MDDGEPQRFVEVLGRRLEYVDIPAGAPDRPAAVLLHEGLGCVAMWGSFPERVAATTGCRTVAYSRPGYGASDPVDGACTPRYLHDEALDVLPALRDALALDRVVLIGHSDGGSIALIHAGADRWPVAGLVVLASHEFVEDAALRGIAEVGREWATTDLPQRLARYHRDAEWVFRSWHDTWLSPWFRDWTIEDCLPGIRCPILAMQGEDDEYATMAQLDTISARATR
ncbi:MAG TPA: alpha/beta hydrolase, partial [Mycobacteriales bacterium]|nr:alpha/beta hydrolase [Mycobacteriales bacterium]